MKSALLLSLLAFQAPNPVDALKAEADALRPQVQTKLANSFLDQVSKLPDPGARSVYRGKEDRNMWISAKQFAALSEEEKKKFGETKLQPPFYYYVRWGSPLSYTRPIEVLAQHGFSSFSGKKILDIGYGQTGHLRLMAELGANAAGVDVDQILMALYSEPGDTGRIGKGSVKLAQGQWPKDRKVVDRLGDGFDLIISKNTLKKGYIHPSQWAPKEQLVDLGVNDTQFLDALNKALKPGGKVLIYNICPAQNPNKYVPWAEGQSPYTKRQWADAGFRILAFDVDDTAGSRAMGKALGWDKQGMDLEKDLATWYTLVEKKR